MQLNFTASIHRDKLRLPQPPKQEDPVVTQQKLLAFNIKNAEDRERSFSESSFIPKGSYIASIYLTGTKTQYNNFPRKPNILLLEKWAASLKANGLKGIVFHNCFTNKSIDKMVGYPVEWISVKIPHNHMSGLYRFELYDHFLNKYGSQIENIFFTDSTDLDVLKSPFSNGFESGKIYIGSEPVVCGNKWMRGAAINYEKYNAILHKDSDFAEHKLLNAGLIGGDVKTLRPYIKRVAEDCRSMYPIVHTQDMPIINYIAYTEFKDKISYGPHINTVFTQYEQNNKTAWFRHK